MEHKHIKLFQHQKKTKKKQKNNNTSTFHISGYPCEEETVRQSPCMEVNRLNFPPQKTNKEMRGTDMSVYGLTQNMRNVQSPMEKR